MSKIFNLSLQISILPYLLVGLGGSAYAGMQMLDDQSLSQETGQSAFFTSYIAPGGSNPNTNIGLFTLGLQANIDINANIKKLQLGCGGVNGAGQCDINIDQLSLVGLKVGADGTYAGTDATLTNPFIQLAIKNPTTLATREVVGFNLGAQAALGRLLIGIDNNPIGSPSINNQIGINSLSGALGVNVSNAVFTNVNVCVGFTLFGACVGAPLSGSATVAAPGNADYTTAANPQGYYQQTISGKRLSTIPDLGPLIAHASGSLLGLILTNVHLNNEPLNNVHDIALEDSTSTTASPVGTKNLSLSLQNQPITWSTRDSSNAVVFSTDPLQKAQTGWWLSLPSVVLKDLSSNQRVDVGAFAALGGAAFGTRVDINPVDLQQFPAYNCYGGLKFC